MGKWKEIDLRKVALAICGKKGLNLTADQRHEIQQDVIGLASLKAMNAGQLESLIAHLRTLQRQQNSPAPPAGSALQAWRFVFKLTPDRQIHARKIYRLAQRCGALLDPPVPVASKAYIEGITTRMRGTTQPLEFCDAEQLHKAAQALEIHLKRHGG